MATEQRADPRNFFVPRILPWLLAAAAFVIYFLTLNRWVSLFNLETVAKTSGWIWEPEFFAPLFFIFTTPFRWLSVAEIPVALNLFSAVCAALTLGLLARSVAILPQDRTDAQREREHGDFSFLTIWSAWLPPVLAVAVCGLQLTFWEQATNGSGEMFELLLFAFVIWQLLEYRLDEREGRLFLTAFVYGAGMVDNWAMIGFFPLFLVAIIWTRKLNFFNVRFLRRMFLCGLLGLLFYLLLPVLAVVSHKVPVTFWQALKFNFSAQWLPLRLFFTSPDVRQTLGLLSLTSLLPVLLLSIRWNSSFGDNSKLGLALTSFMFHVVHAVIFGVCLWVAFDPPFSPRHLGRGLFLTFYYLAALGVGYFCGYFLLVFGKQATSSRSQETKPSPLDFLNKPVTCAVWGLAILAIVGLFYKNAPQIRETNNDTLKKYADLATENLSHDGGVLLADDPRMLFLVQSALAREGRAKDFVPLDTHSLAYPSYHKFLHDRFPRRWPDTVRGAEQTNGVSPLHLIGLLARLGKTNELYYLHPSFGYYFEEFYLEPHGLIYQLKTLPEATLRPPPMSDELIAENEKFWAQIGETALAPVENAVVSPDSIAPDSWEETLFTRLHFQRDQNPNALVAGTFYARGLNFWGVQLQRAGDLTNAAAHFETALKLNPDNIVAQINLQFNQSLQAGRHVPVDLSKTTSDQFGKYRSWNSMLNDNGPFDEPSFCLEDGIILEKDNGFFRQAIASLERVRQLDPDNLAPRLWLAQAYLASRLPDRTLEVLRPPLNDPEKFSLNETNSSQLNIFAAAAYFQKNETVPGSRLLELEISRHPDNDHLLIVAAQAYLLHGMFTNALDILDRKLKLTPDDPNALFSRGYVSIQLKKYNDAIADLTRVLSIQTTNNNALFNRAVAYLESDKLDAARADYQVLRQSFTNSFQIAYGLGEIAWRKHDTNEAILNYEIYLANAKTNTAEATNIIQRLHELKGGSH
jgi:tetratricopeptide (TPR) repeat protein